MKNYTRATWWLFANGNDELTDLWFVLLGICAAFEALLSVFNTVESLEQWKICLEVTNVLVPIITFMGVIRIIKNLFIVAMVTEPTSEWEEFFEALEES